LKHATTLTADAEALNKRDEREREREK